MIGFEILILLNQNTLFETMVLFKQLLYVRV